MKILVINAGSSSLKFQLFEQKNLKCLHKGIIERIGLKGATKNHAQALSEALGQILKQKKLSSLKEISAIGHRVVHGGEKYNNPIKITPQVLKEIKKLCELAPLHNPANLEGIYACQKMLKGIPQYAIFDTAFHQTLPEKAYIYGIPYAYYQKHGIRRYGFHGTSHAYVAAATQKLMGKKESRIVTCHLGNGSSVAAIKNGKSIDTSMGFTPLEGLPMGTRCGDLDPAIVFKLMEVLHVSTDEIDNILNKSSGLKGISKISSDVRDLWQVYKKEKHARLAIEILAYRTAKYIGAYAAALNGLDAITFTAGIGQNAYYIRQMVCDYFGYLGLKLDEKKNRSNSEEISNKKSKIKVYVIPTNEEKWIAMETVNLLTNKNK